MGRVVPVLTRLEDRVTPAGVWEYAPGTDIPLGNLLFVDPEWYADHRDHFAPSWGKVAVGGGWPVVLKNAPPATVFKVAEKFSLVADVVKITNDDPGPGVPHTTVEYGVPAELLYTLAGYPAAGAAALGGTLARVMYQPTDVGAVYVTAHEVGHTFGLQHNPDPASLMYAGVRTDGVEVFLPADLAGIRAGAGVKQAAVRALGGGG